MKPYYRKAGARIYLGDSLESLHRLPRESVQCVITSPPYWGLRDYGVSGQMGLEATPDAYVADMVELFREVRRVLKPDGTLWLNLGDSYAGSWGAQSRGGPPSAKSTLASVKKLSMLSRVQIEAAPKRTKTGSIVSPGLKPKDLVGIPWRVAFALQADGWYLRSDIIWHKPNPMPESVTDRPTKAHEYLFLLSKSERYFYDIDAIREPKSDGEYFHGGYDKPGVLRPTARRNGRDSLPFRGRQMRSSDMETFGLTRGSSNRSCVHPKGRNKRTVWTVTPRPFKGAHFATFPPALVEPCILAGSRPGDTVLDPFSGAATTGIVAAQHRRRYIGLELNSEYCEIAARRLDGLTVKPLAKVA